MSKANTTEEGQRADNSMTKSKAKSRANCKDNGQTAAYNIKEDIVDVLKTAQLSALIWGYAY